MPGLPLIWRRDALFRRALGVTDVAAAYLALFLALEVVPGQTFDLRPAAILIAPFIVLVSKALGLYDADQHRLRKTTLDEAPSLLHLAVFYGLGTWLAQDLVVGGVLARAQVFSLVVLGFLLTMLTRMITRSAVLGLLPAERCLVVGESDDVSRTCAKLAGAPGVNVNIVGRVTLADEVDGLSVLDNSRAFAQLIEEHCVERVVIAPDGAQQEEILHCVRLVKALGIKVSVVPRLLEVVGTSSVFDDVQGTILLGVRQYGLTKSSALLKRSMDVAVAGVAVVLLGPLLILLSVAIRLESPGSPLFRQMRIGIGGQRFWMLKLRTMVPGAEGMKDQFRDLNEAVGGLFKIEDDPRVTRLGRFLRRTSLDELPQFINVLRGEMSLVGPRPLIHDEDLLIEGWQRRRLVVKPGMTGLWQIFGSARIPLPEMVKIDYMYGANWSIWLDLKILLRTIPYVLGRRGL
jgi:exopolysaccharide biosynthesis polyprenyl glycosylphosphotransferase